MNSTGSSPSAPTAHAKSSRACVNCARAKAKCIPNDRSDKCDRCDRLSKHCLPAMPRKARTMKKAPTSSARLEEKLDGLFSLLKSGAHPSAQPGAQAAQVAPQPDCRSDAWSITQPVNGVAVAQHQQYPILKSNHVQAHGSPETFLPDTRAGHVLVHPPTNFYQPRRNILSSPPLTHDHTPSVATSEDPYPAEKDAEAFLNFFRDHMLAYFPFMMLPRYSGSHQFRAEHPFLWLCIMAVTSKSSEQQDALGKEVRSILGRKILVECERSLDLLYGILVYAGWAQSHIHTNPIISNLVQLAIALLGDLGLNKPPPKHPPHIPLNYDVRGCPKPFSQTERTMEERRVAISTFWLSSIISSYFQRLDPMRWTPYLDECLQMIAESAECSTDIHLSFLVRLQLLNGKALEVCANDGLSEPRLAVGSSASFCIKTLSAQLDATRQGIPLELQQNETLQLHIYHTELTIHEIAYHTATTSANVPQIQKTASLFFCVRAIRGWFDIFLQITPAAYISFPTSMFTQLAHCIIALYHVSTFEDPDWDSGMVRDTADLSVILDQVINRMRQVKNAAGLDSNIENPNIYHLSAQKLTTTKQWWDAKMATHAAPVDVNDEVGHELRGDPVDDAWLKDIFGLENWQFDSYVQSLS